MTDPHHGVCESCAEQGSLYLRRISEAVVASLCLRCMHAPNVARITAAQEAEWAKEQVRFRAQRRRAESVA